ncbi:hypothetical protein CROQUDRAFT_667851 [Cronartium quercuum f. sp. fusiforme G11]|uniref:RecA family profile 1 domain-containing protein n=1 Tax=Cronartium quercuum f. sp. fusiforme G11 TaxID=708437 RepID=A0A9P6NQL9_9BASI|nr:hypothetical protein CROQUDRAFT_667851 [Cronartium quercuum f. sp. fusiforme G11]
MALALCQRDDVQASLDSEGSTSSNPNLSDVLAEGLMSNVYPTRVSDTEGLIHAIHYQLPALIGRLAEDSSPTIPVRLIVLDSIGALLRPDGSKTKSSWTLRSSQLNQIADGLKHLAHRYNLAAVVINQVSDVFDALAPRIRTGTDAVKGKGPSFEMPQLENDRLDQPINYVHSTGGVYSSSSGMQSPGRHPVKCSSPKSSAGMDQVASSPLMVYDEQAEHFMGRAPRLRKEASLGLSWSNAINSRIMLHRLTSFRAFPTSNSGKSLPQSVVGDVREARMIFGPFGGEGNAYGATGVRYIIEASGISALEDYLLLNPVSLA